MSEQAELSLQDYLDILKRRWLFLLVPFALISAGSAVFALSIPPVYESSGTILIESQQIPNELVRSTVTSYADERIQVIQQRVLSRDRLLGIAEKFDLFANRPGMTVTSQVETLRRGISINRIANVGGGRNRSTLAFRIGYESGNPAQAYAIANELITQFMDENVKNRTERASETTDFLASEAEKLRRSLEESERELVEFKQLAGDALPEHQDLHLSQLERTESAIKEIERNIKSAQDDVRILEIELSAINEGKASGNAVALTPAQALARVESQLANARSTYTELHPDVQRLRRQAEELRVAIEQGNGEDAAENVEGVGAEFSSVNEARINVRLDSINDRIRSMTEQLQQLIERRNELEDILIRTPQVQLELAKLNRDYQNIREKYEEIQSKEMQARLAESLEEEKKAETFSLIDAAVRPDRPIKPNRKKIMAMGIFMGLAVSVGLTGLLEISDKRVRTMDGLTALLNERPLVAIPYITLDSEVRKRKLFFAWSGFVLVLCLIVALITIHFFYMPLDLFTYKVMDRLG